MNNPVLPEYRLVPSPARPLHAPLPARRADPFQIDGPFVIQFSGGRTSGYMLRRFLDHYDGVLPTDTHVCFANTGKEREETLEFVRECSTQWGVPIRWLEYVSKAAPGKAVEFREVTFETAARHGEPFEACIRDHQALPNTRMRFCTSDLKIRTAWSFMWALGYDEWQSAIGLRADEPKRLRRLYGRESELFEERITPFYDANIGEREVLAYWATAPFDLQLEPGESNCDLCMLKGSGIRLQIMQREPERAAWWRKQEAQWKARWTKPGRPTYDQLFQLAVNQQALPAGLSEDDDECFFCTD